MKDETLVLNRFLPPSPRLRQAGRNDVLRLPRTAAGTRGRSGALEVIAGRVFRVPRAISGEHELPCA